VKALKYKVVARTDVGIRKAVNEDSYLARTTHTSLGNVCMALICDGMGGLQYGEKASQTVVALFDKWFTDVFKETTEVAKDKYNLDLEIERLFLKVNRLLVNYGIENNIKLGTTASLLFIIEDKYFTYHVGDTRIYKYDDRINQITEDHTLVAAKVKNGQLTKEEAKISKEKHILLQCVGVNERLEIHKSCGICSSLDVFLLCCDGLYNRLEHQEIAEFLKNQRKVNEDHMQKSIDYLISTVKNRGETDNISAMIVVPGT